MLRGLLIIGDEAGDAGTSAGEAATAVGIAIVREVRNWQDLEGSEDAFEIVLSDAPLGEPLRAALLAVGIPGVFADTTEAAPDANEPAHPTSEPGEFASGLRTALQACRTSRRSCLGRELALLWKIASQGDLVDAPPATELPSRVIHPPNARYVGAGVAGWRAERPADGRPFRVGGLSCNLEWAVGHADAVDAFLADWDIRRN